MKRFSKLKKADVRVFPNQFTLPPCNLRTLTLVSYGFGPLLIDGDIIMTLRSPA